MAYDGQPGEYEVECEECGDIFMAAGTWEVESYDMCTTRQEFTPDSDETICPDCRNLPVHEVIITIKAEKEDIENAFIKEEQALFSFALEAMAIPSAHVQDIHIKEIG